MVLHLRLNMDVHRENTDVRWVGFHPNLFIVATRLDDLHCSYCNVTFYNRADFQNHCRSDRHQHTIMSDEGKGVV